MPYRDTLLSKSLLKIISERIYSITSMNRSSKGPLIIDSRYRRPRFFFFLFCFFDRQKFSCAFYVTISLYLFFYFFLIFFLTIRFIRVNVTSNVIVRLDSTDLSTRERFHVTVDANQNWYFRNEKERYSDRRRRGSACIYQSRFAQLRRTREALLSRARCVKLINTILSEIIALHDESFVSPLVRAGLNVPGIAVGEDPPNTTYLSHLA